MVLDIGSEIEILLFDQDKIVSYKELNNRFNLTPFQARKELKKFIQSHKNSNDEKSKFYSTYIIIGEDKETHIKRVFLKNESDLSNVTQDVNILSKQIYSIQSNQIDDFEVIYASDLEASKNVNRKANLKITSKLGAVRSNDMEVDSTQSDDEIMMNIEIPTETKTSKSKAKEDQENKPVVKVEKKDESTKQVLVIPKKEPKVLKDAEQIMPDKEKKEKSIFQNDSKKQKFSENDGSSAPPSKASTAAKGKKNIEPAKNQKTMMSFFKKV